MTDELSYEKAMARVGVSAKDIKKLLSMLNKAGRFADYLGLELFSASGTLSVRKRMSTEERAIVLGNTSYGNWDGGDGGERLINGLWVGEGE